VPAVPVPAADDAAVLGPLVRGLALLRAMSAPGAHRQRPSDLVHATGLARATVDRLVATLTRLGFLRQHGRDVELAPHLCALGDAFLAGSGLTGALGPAAEALADALDESVSIAVPDGTGVRFVAQHTRRRAMSLAFRIGDLLPAERCAAGLALAAHWDEDAHAAWRARRAADPEETGFPAVPARREAAAAHAVEDGFRRRTAQAAAQGWAADDGLVEPGLIALAMPVTGADGEPVCAVSVVSHTSRHIPDSLREAALPRLREAAQEMSEALRGAPAGAGAVRGPDGRQGKDELGAGYLQSLARGLAVLCALGTRTGGLTLSQAAAATGLPRATARRALLTLVHLGYAAHDEPDGRRFRLLPRVLDLGYAHLTQLGFPDLVQPHLETLAAEVGESASAAVLEGTDIRYVARVPTHRIMTVNITVGTRFPAFATSMGRVLLAGLPAAERQAVLARSDLRTLTARTVTDPGRLAALLEDVAADGHALVDEELEAGLRSLAVPVHDATGRVVAAVNVPSHAGGTTPGQTVRRLLPALHAAQARIEADLRAVGGPQRK
jgi:IclR family transcriptional regulator, pca regulon regulatory protein